MTYESGQSARGNYDLPDFRLALFKHIDRIGMLFSEKVSDGNQQRHLNISRVDAVEFLEEMLSPYHDPKYIEEVKDVKNDETTNADDRTYSKTKYGALIRLLARKRLLPEEEDELNEGRPNL